MPRILVIEDDPTTAAAIEKQLAASKHEVVCVADGARGLELATREYFDAITLDRMLPGLDGLALVSRLRERSISIPVLMISALSDVDERIAGLRAGGDDYMVKPFSAPEMMARIEVLLRRAASTVGEAIVRSGDIEMNLSRADGDTRRQAAEASAYGVSSSEASGASCRQDRQPPVHIRTGVGLLL